MSRVLLKVGQHIENDAAGVERKYRQGDVFDSTSNDLAQRWPEKFDRADPHPDQLSAGVPTAYAGPATRGREMEQAAVAEAAKAGFDTVNAGQKGQPSTAPANADVAAKYRAALEKMTVPQLLSEAAAEEVDVKGEKDKNKLIGLLCSFKR